MAPSQRRGQGLGLARCLGQLQARRFLRRARSFERMLPPQRPQRPVRVAVAQPTVGRSSRTHTPQCVCVCGTGTGGGLCTHSGLWGRRATRDGAPLTRHVSHEQRGEGEAATAAAAAAVAAAEPDAPAKEGGVDDGREAHPDGGGSAFDRLYAQKRLTAAPPPGPAAGGPPTSHRAVPRAVPCRAPPPGPTPVRRGAASKHQSALRRRARLSTRLRTATPSMQKR